MMSISNSQKVEIEGAHNDYPFKASKAQLWSSMIKAVFWKICDERNNRNFQDKERPFEDVLELAVFNRLYSVALLCNASLLGCITWRNMAMDKMIPVALSDVFFPLHSILLIFVVSVQIVFFERGNQKVSKTAIAIFVAVWFFAAACSFIALPTHSWLWLVSIFNSIQVFMTFIKYSPQAFLNFTRKSTVGFSIGNIVLDFTGGVATLAQMSVQSIDQGSWVNFFGNLGKPLLALISIAFDLIFFYQHFILYHIKASRVSFQRDPESSEPLIKDSDHLQGIATTS